MWKSIKPEVVELGGDFIRGKHNNDTFITRPEVCPELVRRSPEGPAYARDDIGTSFTAPKIAYIAAQLQKLFPKNSALLYKALIVQSARWTSWAERLPESQHLCALKYIGYGLPNVERATTNNVFRITFITEEEKQITAGNVHIYRVKVPTEIKNVASEIRIDTTLTFSAKPRRTRKGFKRYFSTWLDWHSSKFDEKLNDFAERILSSEEDAEDSNEIKTTSSKGFTWSIGKQDNHGIIKGINRNSSSVQKDWTIVKAYELPSEFCIAVQGHAGWSKSDEHYAKYALTISFESVNRDIEIYNAFEIISRVEIPVEHEIESEIEILEDSIHQFLRK